jgi:hypothetical protein
MLTPSLLFSPHRLPQTAEAGRRIEGLIIIIIHSITKYKSLIIMLITNIGGRSGATHRRAKGNAQENDPGVSAVEIQSYKKKVKKKGKKWYIQTCGVESM